MTRFTLKSLTLSTLLILAQVTWDLPVVIYGGVVNLISILKNMADR